MLDFNNEQEQQIRNYGPVPAGSTVLVRLEMLKPQYADRDHAYVSRSKNGLLGLYAQYTVAAGTYEGCQWRENIWLPRRNQKISLSDGQATACNMGGARIRAIIEAHRGVAPRDESPKAQRARQIDDWLDLNGMEFPAVVGIDKHPYTGKYGREYWSNTLSRIVGADKETFSVVKNGGEILTDGPVVGENSGGTSPGATHADPDAWRNNMEPGFPSESSLSDDVPF